MFLKDNVCRDAVAGGCDLAERCTGNSAFCPGDVFAGNETVCRASVDACDQLDRCDGSSAACPPDLKQPFGHVCREAVSVCDKVHARTSHSTSHVARCVRWKFAMVSTLFVHRIRCW